MEKVEWWLERAAARRPAHAGDEARRRATRRSCAFPMAGYELVHHGEGRWNGVAIAVQARAARRATSSRTSATAPVRDSSAGHGGAAARRTSTRSTRRACSSAVVRAASASSASTRRTAASSARRSTPASCAGTTGSAAGCDETARARRALVIGGDLNIAPTDDDVWDAAPCTAARTSRQPERDAFRKLLDWGLVDAYRAVHPETGPLHLVGLPRRQLPQELRDAHRPPAA